MKRGIEPRLDPIETENEQRLRHCELHEQLSKFLYDKTLSFYNLFCNFPTTALRLFSSKYLVDYRYVTKLSYS